MGMRAEAGDAGTKRGGEKIRGEVDLLRSAVLHEIYHYDGT
jgi:hypothetical protein